MNKKEIAEMAQIKQQVHDIDSKLDTHIIEQRQDFDKVFNKIDELKGTYANKWVEKFAIGFLIAFSCGVLTTIVILIIKLISGG